MIITLKGADFSQSNIGTLDSWFISWSGSGLTAASGNVTSIKKDSTTTTTLTYTYNTENYKYTSGTVKDATGATVGNVNGATAGTVTVTINAGNTINGKITVAIVMEYIGTGGTDNGTTPTTYTITYAYKDSSGNTIKTSTTESVTAGTSKTFSTSNAPTIDGYTISKVSPTSATINSNTTVTYTYTAVASGSYGPNLLSTGELNENKSMGSTSSALTMNTDVYTYKYVPIEAGATYYGLNFKRCWWLDADKNDLETYNGKSTSPQWTATAPSTAAYWCGAAYYSEQDIATASFAKVLS